MRSGQTHLETSNVCPKGRDKRALPYMDPPVEDSKNEEHPSDTSMKKTVGSQKICLDEEDEDEEDEDKEDEDKEDEDEEDEDEEDFFPGEECLFWTMMIDVRFPEEAKCVSDGGDIIRDDDHGPVATPRHDDVEMDLHTRIAQAEETGCSAGSEQQEDDVSPLREASVGAFGQHLDEDELHFPQPHLTEVDDAHLTDTSRDEVRIKPATQLEEDMEISPSLKDNKHARPCMQLGEDEHSFSGLHLNNGTNHYPKISHNKSDVGCADQQLEEDENLFSDAQIDSDDATLHIHPEDSARSPPRLQSEDVGICPEGRKFPALCAISNLKERALTRPHSQLTCHGLPSADSPSLNDPDLSMLSPKAEQRAFHMVAPPAEDYDEWPGSRQPEGSDHFPSNGKTGMQAASAVCSEAEERAPSSGPINPNNGQPVAEHLEPVQFIDLEAVQIEDKKYVHQDYPFEYGPNNDSGNRYVSKIDRDRPDLEVSSGVHTSCELSCC